MITTISVLTLSLAKAIGLYMIAAALGGLLEPTRWQRVFDQLKRGDALMYITGIIAFALGAAIILAHNFWSDPLAIIVTLLGYAVAIEGLIMLVRPAPLLAFGASFVRPGPVKIWSIAILILGAILLACGLFGRVGL